MKGETKAKAEMILMGVVVPVTSKTEAEEMTAYVLSVLKGGKPKDHMTEAKEAVGGTCRYSENTIKHMVVNTAHDMVTIAYTLDSHCEDEPYPEDLTTPDGVFSYVYNVTVDYFSELGYTFYTKRPNGTYKRIG